MRLGAVIISLKRPFLAPTIVANIYLSLSWIPIYPDLLSASLPPWPLRKARRLYTIVYLISISLSSVLSFLNYTPDLSGRFRRFFGPSLDLVWEDSLFCSISFVFEMVVESMADAAQEQCITIYPYIT